MIIIKTPDDLAHMRVSGQMAAEVLDAVARKVGPGVTTGELNVFAAELIGRWGGKSAFFGYRGYPGHICVSVNDEVVHGIPGSRRIQIGDVVSLDVGVVYDGFVGDTATTVMVGVNDPEVIRLVNTGQKALDVAIAKVVAGARLSDVSHAIETVATDAGLFRRAGFCGPWGRSQHA
jgi:methionyl aminopeptidase